MKNIFTILFILSGIVLFFTIRKCRTIKSSMINSMRNLFYCGIFSTVANIGILLSQNEFFSLFFYSLFFVGIDGIVFFLFNFTLYYIDIKLNKKLISKIASYIFFADAFNMFLNIFLKHAFGIMEVIYQDSVYLLADHFFLYNLHLFLSYATIGLVFAMLVYKAIISPKMYRVKYLSLLFAFGVVTIGDAFYVFLQMPIDFSVILFSTTGIIFYYITFHFTPHAMIEKALSLVVENMEHAIIFFDENGRCIYKNRSFEDLMIKYKNIGILSQDFITDDITESDLFGSIIDSRDHNQEFNKVFEVDGSTQYINLKYHSLKDEKEKCIGSFFLIQDRTSEEEKIRYEKYLSTHDSFTGLYNKFYFYEKAQQTLQKEKDKKYLMVCTKISNFKFINEVFGNYVIDQFLQKYSEKLLSTTNKDVLYSRLDNDLFGIMIPKDAFDLDKLVNFTQHFSKISKEKYLPIQILIGIYEIEDINIPVSVICDRANMAITSIKNPESNPVGYYNMEIKNRLFFEQTIISDFSKAINEKQFKIFLQPQFTAEREIYGAEVLARWYHPTEGLLAPEQFIHLFENNGIVTQLDMYVWEETAKILQKWNSKGINNIPLSVNISPKDFCYIDIYDYFMNLVKKHKIKPSQIKLEISETAFMIDSKTQGSIISKLRKAGFLVDLDDFGTGYSSLNIVRDIVFDEVKFDLTDFQQSDNIQRTRRIISTVLQLAQGLEIPVISEGVETKEQFEFIKEFGGKIFQGFYFEKPIEISQFEKKYINIEK